MTSFESGLTKVFNWIDVKAATFECWSFFNDLNAASSWNLKETEVLFLENNKHFDNWIEASLNIFWKIWINVWSLFQDNWMKLLCESLAMFVADIAQKNFGKMY